MHKPIILLAFLFVLKSFSAAATPKSVEYFFKMEHDADLVILYHPSDEKDNMKIR